MDIKLSNKKPYPQTTKQKQYTQNMFNNNRQRIDKDNYIQHHIRYNRFIDSLGKSNPSPTSRIEQTFGKINDTLDEIDKLIK